MDKKPIIYICINIIICIFLGVAYSLFNSDFFYGFAICSAFITGNIITLITFNTVKIEDKEIIITPQNQINIGCNTYICFQNKPLKFWNIVRYIDKTLEAGHEDEYLIKNFCKTYRLSQESPKNSLLALEDICIKATSDTEHANIIRTIKRSIANLKQS